MNGYDADTLVMIGKLLKGIEDAETDTGPLYLQGPIEIRTEDSTYGAIVSEDGLWTFRPHAGGPRDVPDEAGS